MTGLNIPLNPRKLSFREKSLLIGKLLDCPQMRDRHSRNAMVQELSFASSIFRLEVDRNDVRSIVDASLNYEGGLQELVIVIADYEKDMDGRDSLPMQRLSNFLKALFSSLEPITINVDLLNELYQLIENVDVVENDLYDAYCESRPAGWASPQFQCSEVGGLLSQMIRNLAQVGPQNSRTDNKLTHPLLTFIKLLSRRVPSPVSNKLILWREKTAAKENFTLEEEHVQGLLAEQPAEASFYLLVRFKPDPYDCTRLANEPENFDVRAYFIREQNGKMEYLEGVFDDVIKAEVYERDFLPSLLANLISCCDLWFLQHRQYTNTLIIELFLPFTLLPRDNDNHADIHQWMIKDKTGNTTIISHKYPLVVRLYNRTYEGEPSIWLDWQRNWAKCKGYKGCIDDAKLRLLKVQQYHEEQDDLHVSLQDVLCLGMTFVPPRFDGTPQHIFNKMMSAGTSVALWPRAKDVNLDEEAIEQTYRVLLAACNFPTLPKKLWESRRRALRETTFHPGHQLTLFWDDPDRLPLDAPCYPYAAPRERS